MDLSTEQFKLLKAFYEKKIILYSDLPKYGTTAHSSLIRYLTSKHFIKTIELYPKDGYPTRTMAYKIREEGEVAYEEYIRTIESHTYNERQTTASENSNKIAVWALIISIIAWITSLSQIFKDIFSNGCA